METKVIDQKIETFLARLQRRLDKGSAKYVHGTVEDVNVIIYRGEPPWAAQVRAVAEECGIPCGTCPTYFDDKKAKRQEYMRQYREAHADKLSEYMTKYNAGRKRRKPTEAKGEGE